MSNFQTGDKIVVGVGSGNDKMEFIAEFICHDPMDGDCVFITDEDSCPISTSWSLTTNHRIYKFLPLEVRDSLLGKEVYFYPAEFCKLLKEKPKGMNCCNRFCNEFFEHVSPNVGNHFMCYRCRSEPLTRQTTLSFLGIIE